MAKERTTPTRPIRLSFRDEKQVVVEPDDQDRFVVTMREAALACKQAENEKEFQKVFRQLLIYLEEWGETHADRVNSVVVCVGDGSLNVMVCTVSELYDIELDDVISELDLELIKTFPWLVAEVMQVPGSIQGDRIPFEKAILVYGDGKPTQAAS